MGVAIVLYGIAIIFMMICVGTVMGALSKATSDKAKAKTMGITAFTFCLLSLLFAGGGYGASKIGVQNAPAR